MGLLKLSLELLDTIIRQSYGIKVLSAQKRFKYGNPGVALVQLRKSAATTCPSAPMERLGP
jgi:hypothetical protein